MFLMKLKPLSAYTALQGESLSAECHLNFILLINAESIYVWKKKSGCSCVGKLYVGIMLPRVQRGLVEHCWALYIQDLSV